MFARQVLLVQQSLLKLLRRSLAGFFYEASYKFRFEFQLNT